MYAKMSKTFTDCEECIIALIFNLSSVNKCEKSVRLSRQRHLAEELSSPKCLLQSMIYFFVS